MQVTTLVNEVNLKIQQVWNYFGYILYSFHQRCFTKGEINLAKRKLLCNILTVDKKHLKLLAEGYADKSEPEDSDIKPEGAVLKIIQVIVKAA